MNKNKFCYRCKISMQKQIVVNKDKIQTLRFICPACQLYEEEDCDISGSKFSAWSELDVLREN